MPMQQDTGPGQEQMHRPGCRQQTDDRADEQDQIQMAQPQQQIQIHATASTRAQQPDQTKPQTSEQNTVPDSTQYTDTDTGTWKPGP